MARYGQSSYKLGPRGANPNAENGWGPYKWPAGVPANLRATFSYQQVNGLKQRITGDVRKELVELFQLAAAIADRKYNYQIYANKDGVNWGPWTYSNRAIAGTNTASNHSRALAWDVNAPLNGYASGFSTISSDIPPALVNDWERIGLSWGGRYGDAMHFEANITPAQVPAHVALAKQILGGSVPDTPPTDPPIPPEDDSMSAADVAALKAYIDTKFAELPTQVWTKGITGGAPHQAANALLATAAANSAVAATQATIAASDYDVIIYEDAGGLWWSEDGVSTAIPDPDTLGGLEMVAGQAGKRVLHWAGGDVDLPGAFGARNGVIPGPDSEHNPPAKTYTVAKGDSFNAIAAKLGVSPDALAAANPALKDRNNLDVGQVLNVPK